MKADINDGFMRVANTLAAAFPLFGMSASARDVLDLIMLSAWGQATRTPGYVCRRTAAEIVKILSNKYSETHIYHAIRELRKLTILTPDKKTLEIDPYCIKNLSPQDLETYEFILETHNENRVFSRPKIPVFRPTEENRSKTAKNRSRLYKDAHAERERERLKSSSYPATKDLENTVPKADDDDFKAQSQRLRQNLLTEAVKVSRRPQADLAAELDGVGGRTPGELRLGMARVLAGLRRGNLRAVVNLRGLVASASDPGRGGWPEMTEPEIEALAAASPQAQKPAIDAEAMLAAARAREAEQRQSYRP